MGVLLGGIKLYKFVVILEGIWAPKNHSALFGLVSFFLTPDRSGYTIYHTQKAPWGLVDIFHL